MNELLNKPTPESAVFFFLCELVGEIYKHEGIYLHIIEGIVMEVIEDKEDLPEDYDITGGFY